MARGDDIGAIARATPGVLGPDTSEIQRLTEITAQEQADDAEVTIPARAVVGRLLNLTAGGSDAIASPILCDDTDWTVELQANAIPGGVLSTLAATGYFVASITYGIGGAKFTKMLAPVGLRVRRWAGTGRQVSVNVTWQGAGPAGNPSSGVTIAGNPTLNVWAAISRGGQNKAPIEWWAPEWILSQPGGTTDALYGGAAPQLVSGAAAQGVLLAARLAVATMPTGAGATGNMVMLFDSPSGTAPTDDASPIWRSKPLIAASDWDAYDDEFGPQIEWNQGLWVAQSSTYNNWTACGAGGGFTFDLKQGS